MSSFLERDDRNQNVACLYSLFLGEKKKNIGILTTQINNNNKK